MFRIHRNLLPSCNSYEGAVRVFEDAHQVASFGGWRGLKDRRDSSKLVLKMGDGSVKFRFHHTDLVTWMADKIGISTYDSQNSVVFTNQFLPPGMYARSIRGEMYICHKGMTYMPQHGSLVFNRVGNQWVVDESKVMRWSTETLDRKAAARVRKVMKPFIDYRDCVDKICGPYYGEFMYGKYDLYESLKVSIARGFIPEDHFPLLLKCEVRRDDFLQNCYVLGGAVKRDQLPLGEVRKSTPYKNLSAWGYV